MTNIKFLLEGKALCGFEISGHSSQSFDDIAGRLICASVSSAAYLTANTISEIVGDSIEAEVGDEEGYMRIFVNNPSKEADIVLRGFKLHITELSRQYKNNIRIITEV